MSRNSTGEALKAQRERRLDTRRAATAVVLAEIGDNPGISRKILQDKTGISEKILRNIVESLMRRQIKNRGRAGKDHRYYLRDQPVIAEMGDGNWPILALVAMPVLSPELNRWAR